MNLSDKSVLVFDHGTFTEFAIRLARDFGKVWYHCPWMTDCSRARDAAVGQGFDEIEWCKDPYDPEFLSGIDLCAFPDVGHSGSQLLFEQLGKRVWGSRRADTLELLRDKFKALQKRLSMPVPPHAVIVGLSNLESYLKDHEHVFVKINRFRGSMETWEHINMVQSRQKLHQLAIELGGMAGAAVFVVEQKLDAFVEVGGDTYCVDGQFPQFVMQGIEKKNACYIGSLQEYSDLPEAVRQVNEGIAPELARYHYRNFWSTEIRVTEDSTPYFIDPTCRHPSPAGESQLELYANLSDIVWQGADGELVQPEPMAQFAVQLLIEHTGDAADWRILEVPDKIRQWVKLRYACKVDDHYEIVPQKPPHEPAIGWVLGIGDTLKEAIGHAQNIGKQLDGQNLVVHTEFVRDVLKDIEKEEKHGVEFTDQPIPEPEELKL